MSVFVDAVDMEPIPGIVGRSCVSQLVVAIVKGEVIGSFPLEHEFVGLDVDFLEIAVPDPGNAFAAVLGEIPWYGTICGHQGCVVFCDFEFVEIARQVAARPDHLELSVILVKLWLCQYRALLQVFRRSLTM